MHKFQTHFATSFFNYTSDHHLLSLRIPKDGNTFNADFLKKISFNVEQETRTKPIQHKRSFPEISPKDEVVRKRRRTESKASVDLTSEDETHHRRSSEDQSGIDLTCLFSPNWLNDEVINTYLKLLNKQ